MAQARAVASGAPQVRFVQSDVRDFPVERSFNAVVGRFVQMYLADPVNVLRQLAGSMPLFMTQFSYTPEAWAALSKNPEDRRGQLRQLNESLGGRLIEVYYSFGEYDGLTISEFPDGTAATASVLAALGPGHIKAVKTTLLLTVEQTLEALRRAGSLTYHGPQA